jgi:hypothetical protein
MPLRVSDGPSRRLLGAETEPSHGEGNVAPTPVGLPTFSTWVHMKIAVEVEIEIAGRIRKYHELVLPL